jgi:predicted N-acyltransferase
MPDGREAATVRIVEHINEIPADQWDACTGGRNPFVGHAFLNALEESESVDPRTGWMPQHLVVDGADGKVIACAPLYLKSHSHGEYVFDWGWADAYERAGGDYYPKLQSAVPFTPATGPRLLVRTGAPDAYYDVLIAGMVQLAKNYRVSSLHVTFPPEDQWRRMGEAGFLLRTAKQFHWRNQGYETFNDFLATLQSRKRKAIRKERREVAEQGVKLSALTGDDIKSRHWDAFFEFYMDTAGRKWGRPYLNREFFARLGDTMSHLAVLVVAEDDGELVAGALNLRGEDTLFGRNWGCTKEFRYLHFEACYYQAIDFAIEHRLEWVEAGAQGPHKIQRGYLPRETYSAHWIENQSFRDAVENFLRQERQENDREIGAMMEYSPYRKDEND